MHTVDYRRGLGLQCLCRRDIGRDHEIFDYSVRVDPFAHSDLGNLPLVIKHNAALWQFKFQRIARMPRLFQ